MFIGAQVARLSVHSEFDRAEGLYWRLSQSCWSRAARAVLVIVCERTYGCVHARTEKHWLETEGEQK